MHFEYKAVRYSERNTQRQLDIDALDQGLNELGKQGWELVSLNIIGANTPIAAFAVFKRPAN